MSESPSPSKSMTKRCQPGHHVPVACDVNPVPVLIILIHAPVIGLNRKKSVSASVLKLTGLTVHPGSHEPLVLLKPPPARLTCRVHPPVIGLYVSTSPLPSPLRSTMGRGRTVEETVKLQKAVAAPFA